MTLYRPDGVLGLRARAVICCCLSAKLESSFKRRLCFPCSSPSNRLSRAWSFPSTHLLLPVSLVSLPAQLRSINSTPLCLRAMTAAGVSPSSSPRLPSPPPFTEVQIGPLSPSVGESFGKDAEQFLGAGDDGGSTRRIRPGTKTADMAFGPPLIPLSQVCTSLH